LELDSGRPRARDREGHDRRAGGPVRDTLVSFARAEDGRTRVELRLDYELAQSGPLRALADVLFIRRALTQALHRTLARFAAEAAEEAAL
jgi:uncharacterized membrane protein